LGCGAAGLPGRPGPRGGPDAGRSGRGCGVREGGGYGAALCESASAGPEELGITRVRSSSACWGSCPYSQSRSSSRPGDMSAKVPGDSWQLFLSAQRAISRRVGVPSPRSRQVPNILAGIFPEIPSPQQTERLPRCQFAPRMLGRARRPPFPRVSSEANASKDAEV